MKKVAIVKCNKYEEEKVYQAVKQSFDLIGGLQKYVKPGMKVGIKPNLLMAKTPEHQATTHPYIIGAVGRLVKECKAEAIVIESPGGPYFLAYLKKTYKACGMTAICKKYGITLNQDLSVKSVLVKTERNTRKINVLKPLTECDLIINACKMKTHAMMIFTGAIKNMFGSIAGTEKAAYHINSADYQKFADDLIDIYNTTKPALNIMDGIIAMEGEGPSSGIPKNVGLILASEDGFALDSLAHDVLQISKEQSYIMNNAAKRGIDLSYEAVGEKLEDVIISDFKVPFTRIRSSYGFLNKIMDQSKSKPVVNKDICIGCQICKKNCPAKCITMVNNKPTFDYSTCIRCFCCQELCPESAIKAKRPLLIKILSGGR